MFSLLKFYFQIAGFEIYRHQLKVACLSDFMVVGSRKLDRKVIIATIMPEAIYLC